MCISVKGIFAIPQGPLDLLKLQIGRILAVLSNRIKQLLRLIPTKAGICDGFSVDVIATDLLIAWLDIALDHETLYH